MLQLSTLRMRTTLALWSVGLSVLILSGCTPQKPAAVAEAYDILPSQVDYNQHIKPLLSDRCFPCHGPDNNARQGDLRLDTEDGMFARLNHSKRARAIVPASLRKSEVFHRLIANEETERMPPPESNLSLAPEEIAMILKWIEQGAEYKPHWSRIPPERPELPAISRTSWPRNGIDHFVLARLDREGLAPQNEATRETLMRRVTFDLTGLPPTLDALDAFLADTSEAAYERVVDRLLASPAYGERMAAEWLDVARYGDSHGYQDDGLRNMWPWRDWVIRVFNDNIRFDDFVTWQLAGDLLPEPTGDQILATGFNRNHLQSQEGGIVPEEYRVEYVADRTETFGKAFLALTVRCARCHDHKFDPFSQKEYYELYSFFNSINEFGNIPYAGEASPTLILVDKDSEQRLATLSKQINELENQTAIDDTTYDNGFEQWLARRPAELATVDPIAHYPLDAVVERKLTNEVTTAIPALLKGDPDKETRTVPGKVDGAQELVGNPYIDMGPEIGYFERNDPFTISLWFNIVRDSVEGPLFSKSGGLFNGNRGYVGMLRKDGTLAVSLNHVFPANSIEIVTQGPLPRHDWHHLAMTYDGSSRAAGLALYLDGARLPARVVVDNLKKSILYTVDPRTGEQTNWGDAGNLRLGWIEANAVTLDNVAVDEVKVFDTHLTTLEVAATAGKAVVSDAEPDALREQYVRRYDATYRERFARLTRLRGEVNTLMTALPEVMVMEELAEPRPTHILVRGMYDAPGERVEYGTPVSILPFPEEYPNDRLGLARWLLDEDNPLTARVAVNRYWQMYFGRGLVLTTEDFGNQGALPSHPLLLDYLATRFIESGWIIKELQKEIVLSATYRQASVAAAALMERDPNNILLARGPSYRMPAEMIRDNLLAVSGLLVPIIGGPPVKPYQPPGLWKELATRNATEYVQDHGDNLYRRSMYTIWKRTTPPPAMISFDAPERNVCTVRRQSTSTPLQALVLLNDPQNVEAARMLAERMLREGDPTIEDRITYAFRLLTSRHPAQDELQVLVQLYAQELAAFESGAADAGDLLSVGEYPRDMSLPATQIAALTMVASTIMNFDTAIMKR